jgi:signal transduction histidine kinase
MHMTIEGTARVAAPVGLALFGVAGAVMGNRPILVGLAVAGAVAGLAGILAWERMSGWPLAAALAIITCGIVVLGHAESANLVWFGLCVAAAWVALTSALPVALTVGGVLGVTVVSEWIQQTEEPGWAAWFVGTAFTVVACTFARRLRLTVEQLREAQHVLAERSRAEERNRIAAEVHDVLGHVLTVSLLHIGSARLALDDEPEEARHALGEAERLTRESLEEVRASMGLMRADAPGRIAPLPDATAIPELVESFRRARVPVQLTVSGDLGELGPARGLAAYRIVQEALTNATRHAPGEAVTVEITVDDGEAGVTVANDGPVDPRAPRGSGLRNMRDRAESVGGRLEAGALQPATRQGWLVEAVLPG